MSDECPDHSLVREVDRRLIKVETIITNDHEQLKSRTSALEATTLRKDEFAALVQRVAVLEKSQSRTLAIASAVGTGIGWIIGRVFK